MNQIIYNRGDLAWRSLAIATVAANASGATWKREDFVNFGFCSAEFCKGLKNRKFCMFENMFVSFGFCSAEFCKGFKNRKLCMFENMFVSFGFCSAEFCKFCKNRKFCVFENLADVAGRQDKAVCARVRQFYEEHCNRKLSDRK